MPISRTQAIVRLIGAWCDSVITDEDYGLRVTLADALSLDAIEAVVSGNLLAEYDLDRRLDNLAQIERETQRQQELVRQWLSVPAGAAQ